MSVNQTITEIAGRKLRISAHCTTTNTKYFVDVDDDKYVSWSSGNGLIQNVFPELDEGQREFLITGYTPAEWANIFSDEEADEWSADESVSNDSTGGA